MPPALVQAATVPVVRPRMRSGKLSAVYGRSIAMSPLVPMISKSDRQHRIARARKLKPQHACEPRKRDRERSRQPTISCSSGCKDKQR